jgi:biotin transport system substrate-specific component
MQHDAPPLRPMVYASLLTALIVLGAYVAIPIGPVPIVLQNMFVLLAGLLLGPGWGFASVLLYLGLGALGLPVFAGGGAGIAHLVGPTGGYLASYLPAVVVTGLLSRGERGLGQDILAGAAGSVVVYLGGIPWLMHIAGVDLRWALLAGCLPFLPGDAVKVVAAGLAARALRPVMWERR